MERFIDRLRAGKCRPLTPALLGDPIAYENMVREEIGATMLARRGLRLSERELDELTKMGIANAIRGVERFDMSQLTGIPVIAADEVADYCRLLPPGTDTSDIVASMAPPFNRFFVDIQGVPNPYDATAWGVYVEAEEHPLLDPHDGDDGVPRWVLTLHTFLENQPWVSVGPVCTHVVGLAEDGTWFRHGDGDTYFGARMAQMEPEPPQEIAHEWVEGMIRYIVPVLLAISLMHCRNVEIRTVEPDEQVSRAHKRRYHHRLVRYQVLDIEPMRRILDAAGAQQSSTGGLHRALTICRGHFKTFTPDAPLFGRHTGQYWWAPHVRGDAAAGVIVNDYRVHTLAPVGTAYREASEALPLTPVAAVPGGDPDAAGAGRVAHNRTQNALARVVRELGWLPRSPSADEPPYDIAWSREGVVWIAEVKSITPGNEERQLRTAMGQVLRYRQKMVAMGHDVQAAIMTSATPTDSTWDDLCTWEGIVLAWPDVVSERIASLPAQL